MDIIFLCIVAFLIILAIFDLTVGVSNDAVNFLSSAIGAKAAKYRTVVTVAAVGVFAGACLSNGMMDVVRNGIMTPMYFSFYDVMCIFLTVMVADVILLDVFNTLGLPTSTTVSLVFELLGAAAAIALLHIMDGRTDAEGNLLSWGDMINTEKAMTVILAIFLSVAIAFVMGTLVQWLARICFTFTGKSSIKNGIFGGIALTSIIWFLLIKGLKDSALMTPELKQFIDQNTWLIIGGGIGVFSVLMTILSMLRVPILKLVVLFGTFALAMAFAGNDLVNFVGVPITGLEAYQDYIANGNGSAEGFMMTSLMSSAQTPIIYLVLAGVVMVLALIFSKKAQNVVKTSVDLSRQDEGDEMFGSSSMARTLVRTSNKMATRIAEIVPAPVGRWIDSRFNIESANLPQGAAFDMVRASINLVLSGLLVAIGTSFKLPLSTTYVTFMVAMGTSLADRAWSRESAVFRITGVVSVIGGWFITAGAAFLLGALITIFMYFGGFVAMLVSVGMVVVILVRNNIVYSKRKQEEQADVLFKQLVRSTNHAEAWEMLCQHVRENSSKMLQFVTESYISISDAFFHEEFRKLRRAETTIEEEKKNTKRLRRKHIVGLRRVDPILATQKNTWYFLFINALMQMLHVMKRINEPCLEHVGNNFSPVSTQYASAFKAYRDETVKLLHRTITMIEKQEFQNAETIRKDAQELHNTLSAYRQVIINDIHTVHTSLEPMTVYLNLVQETQELLSSLRHMIRGIRRFHEV